jgi:cytosine/adenosine deaminase-related metal-dependent hydrolase
MDASVGKLERGDVLIEDGRIAQVVTDVATDAQVIDASGNVVMPGFVDTHRHMWQTALRAICADWTLMEYFRGMIRQTISPRYRPKDVGAGNYVGALEALEAGVTTILDFSHCVDSPPTTQPWTTTEHPTGLTASLLHREPIGLVAGVGANL